MVYEDLNEDPGLGELNVRVRVAAVIGPMRVVHGARAVKTVEGTKAIKIAAGVTGDGNRNEVIFVQVSLQKGAPSPTQVLFSSSESVGQNDIPFTFDSAVGTYNVFTAVLLPGEQLYAQAAGNVKVRLVVSAVTV